jgi:hypothetical protein
MRDEQAISADLLKRWGPEVQRVGHQLNLLIGKALGERNLIAFGFISEVVAAIMLEAVELAKEIQGEQQSAKAGHLH